MIENTDNTESSDVASMNETQTFETSDSNISEPEQSESERILQNQRITTLKEKLRSWALKNINTLNNKVLSELLCLLRTEGHELPKTASALLNTRGKVLVQPMVSSRKTTGSYIYFGIRAGLEQKLKSDVYTEDFIPVLVNIDGIPIHRNSKQQFWPILIQLYHNDYNCSPIIVAIYLGDSKPDSTEIFLADFVAESQELIQNGLVINGKKFSFKIAAFVCDTPARSFIKYCKSHVGFFAFERCETKGVTASNKRVYPEINAALRTEASFREKRQPAHHLENNTSPVLQIPGFDPVKGFVLDQMHLLFLGVTKSLIDKWINGNNIARIAKRKRILFKELLLSQSSYIPCEFQRKQLQLDDLSNWKATQYRLFLLYSGVVVLRYVLPTGHYQHFLLLFTACRILCSDQLATDYTNYANELLRKFFYLLPSLYGRDSQVMNFHNLIHLTNDVDYMQASLNHYSAFPFQNCLGFLKKLIRTPNKPLAQVAKRLSELEAGSSITSQHQLIKNCTKKKKVETTLHNIQTGTETLNCQKIKIFDVTVGVSPPDNLVQLSNGEIIQVCDIFSHTKNKHPLPETLHLEG